MGRVGQKVCFIGATGHKTITSPVRRIDILNLQAEGANDAAPRTEAFQNIFLIFGLDGEKLRGRSKPLLAKVQVISSFQFTVTCGSGWPKPRTSKARQRQFQRDQH